MMKCYGLPLVCCILCSCGHTSTTHNAVSVVNTSINALEESLSKECKTKAIELQIASIKEQVQVIELSCDNDIAKVKSQKIKWQTACLGLLLLIGLYVFKKVYPRFI